MAAPAPFTMHAVVQQRFGGPDVLRLAEVPRPESRPTEVLRRVHAAAGGVGHLLLLGSARLARQAPTPALLVLAKADGTLAIVDPATRAVLARIPVGPDPHEVVASPDGRFAYVSNYEGGAGHTLTVVDLAAQRVVRTIELGALRGPHGLAFAGTASGGALWFTAEGAKAVGRYDPAAGAVDRVVGTGQDRTHMLVVLPTGSAGARVVTTNVRAGTVSVLDPRPGGAGRAEWDAAVVPVGPGAEGVDVAPNGTEAWVANAGDGTISVVDLAAKRVVQTLAAGIRGANRLKFTPDGTLVFVSTLGGPDVTVLRAATRAVVARIPVGRGAAGIQMQPDGARAYVACTPDDNVAVVDVASLTIVGRIRAGHEPDGLAWAVRP